jgi:hypothetical protein
MTTITRTEQAETITYTATIDGEINRSRPCLAALKNRR